MTMDDFKKEMEQNADLKTDFDTAARNGSQKEFLTGHGVEVSPNALSDKDLEKVTGGFLFFFF